MAECIACGAPTKDNAATRCRTCRKPVCERCILYAPTGREYCPDCFEDLDVSEWSGEDDP